MEHITNMIIRMKSREKSFLYFSYTANVMVTCILVMIATGIKNITNESLSSSDLQQIQSIFASVIAVSIIAIAFFQWIIAMQFQSLFDSRKQFNNNMRLMGASDKGLFCVYFKEMLSMQMISIVVGMVLAEIVFYALSKKLDTSVQFIAITQLLLAAVIHLVIIMFCVISTYRKLTKINIIDEIRGVNYAKEKKRNVILGIINAIVGISILVTSIIMSVIGEKGSDLQAYGWFGIIIALFMLFDLIVMFVHKILSRIGKIFAKRTIIFSEAISIGYIQKSKASGSMILFSAMMFLGLNMLFTNVRVCGSDTVENRVHYEGSAWFDSVQEASKDEYDSNVYQGLKFKTKQSGSAWYILGVSSEFEGAYEEIKLDDSYGGTREEMLENLGNSDFDGIYMPNYYIKEEEIGKQITITVDGVEVAFHIAGAYYSNNLSHISFFVSKAYLSKALGLDEDAYNILYFNDEESWEAFEPNDVCTLQTFEEIREESYEKAVSGTSLVEMVAVVIILCAIISLVNFIMISSKSDTFDIARLRGIGLSENQVKKIYVMESLMPVVLAMIIAIPISILFALIGCGMVFDLGYYHRDLIILPMQMLGLLIIFALVSLVTRMVALRKVISTDSYVDLLREVRE